MPYTPPATRSPTSSAVPSPEGSRRPSLQSGARPCLPRSASYLTRQPRRTNSWSERAVEQTATTNTLLNSNPKAQPSPQDMIGFSSLTQTTPPRTSEDLPSLIYNSNIRQSPPPITDARSMPNGAIISPPDSSNSSSDEGDAPVRGRQLDRQIKELQEAISHIPQRPSMSPPREKPDSLEIAVSNSPLTNENVRHSFSTESLGGLAVPPRKIRHQKSNTEPQIIISPTFGASSTGSEEDSDFDISKKPAMVRKKSGELVRPALRASSRKRPSSMPGTPTFSKNVHFDACLEHVRHFCDIDRPSAVSAGSSPVETYDTDDEFPFQANKKRTPPFEWELVLNNFPGPIEATISRPVRMERVWLSADQKSLMGSVIVANLAFQKSIACRFTLDYWKTTSEVGADFAQEVRPSEGASGHDRFHFNIKLSETANLENKTLYFCIRYNVNGSEYWDNNNHANFQVDFRKKMLPQNGKRGFQGSSARKSNGLPRSSRRGAPGSRPKSGSNELDDFRSPNISDRKYIHEMIGESESVSGLRLKGVKSASSLASDNIPSRVGSPSGQAFSNRYDFGASLSAAKQAAKTSPQSDNDADGLYMKPNRRGEGVNTTPKTPKKTSSSVSRTKPTLQVKTSTPAAFLPATSSIGSSSYEEILSKYCFYGSKQDQKPLNDASMPKEPTAESTREDTTMRSVNERDGTNGSLGANSHSTTSSYSPERKHESTAQHHSLHPIENDFVCGSPLISPTSQVGSRSSSPASLANGFASLASTCAPTPIRG